MLGHTHRAGPARRRGGLTLLAGGLVLASLGALVLAPAHDALAATATATADLSLRAGPGEEYELLTVIPAGAGISVDGDAVNGYFPVTFDGVSGWAAAGYVALSGGEAAPVAKDIVAAPTDAVAPPGEPLADPAAEPVAEPPAAAETAAPPPAAAGGYGEQEIIRIIHEAADRYGQPREDMVRVARCESGLNPRAVDPAGLYYGLYQFVPSTFAGTPYGQYDILDPWANAHAAAWMWSQGRRGEWVCQ